MFSFNNEDKKNIRKVSEEYQEVIKAKDLQIEEYKRIIAYYEEAYSSIRKVLANQERISDKSLEFLDSLQSMNKISGDDGDEK